MFSKQPKRAQPPANPEQIAAEKELLVNELITVHIWTSVGNVHKPGSNVGHAAIEAAGQYMSLWPKQAVCDPTTGELRPAAKEAEGLGIRHGIEKEWLGSFENDLAYEGRPPEYTFHFFTLNQTNLLAKAQAMKATADNGGIAGWCLLGGYCQNAESCASAAWKLLIAAGINRLLNTAQSVAGSSQDASHGSGAASADAASSDGQAAKAHGFFALEQALTHLVQSPDSLATQLNIACQNERQRKPLTTALATAEQAKRTTPSEAVEDEAAATAPATPHQPS